MLCSRSKVQPKAALSLLHHYSLCDTCKQRDNFRRVRICLVLRCFHRFDMLHVKVLPLPANSYEVLKRLVGSGCFHMLTTPA